jgi:3-oxoadipate CoA-transferase beta subunit
VAEFLPSDREIILHSENGLLGMGGKAAEGSEDPDLLNAGKIYVTEKPGASYFHHADSFAMMRGGHIDFCVMGAFQVSRHGDLANWRTNASDSIPSVGGAMDLAAGARQVYVVMELFTKNGESKIVENCTYPLTGTGCVDRVYSDYAIFEFAEGAIRVLEIFDPIEIEELSTLLNLELIDFRK